MLETYYILAIIPFGIIALMIIIRWFCILPFIWFKYDSKILKLKKELDEFRVMERDRLAPMHIIDGSIDEKTRDTDEKLNILEAKRRLFLDRAKIFLSVLPVSDK